MPYIHFLLPLGLPESSDLSVMTMSSHSLHDFMVAHAEKTEDYHKNGLYKYRCPHGGQVNVNHLPPC